MNMILMIKKYKVAIITILLVVLLGISGLVIYNIYDSQVIREIENQVYAFQYDKNWKIDESDDNSIVLKHKSGSKIYIEVQELNDEFAYSSIDELIDEIIYSVQSQNESYRFITSKKEKLTMYQFDGYKLLYENDEEQIMLNIFKKSNKLVIIRYEATNEYFDILLDSVNSIIYSFNTKDEVFKLDSQLNLKTTAISYDSNNVLDKLLSDTSTYEIANNNYLVEYSIPSNFVLKSFDSTFGYFTFQVDDDFRIELDVGILNVNIYEFLDRNSSVNVYNSFNAYYDEASVSKYKETLTKVDNDTYIFKNSYIDSYDDYTENVVFIKSLNNNHIIKMALTSPQAITEKLVGMLKVNSSKNYSSYITSTLEDGFLIATLKRYNYYNYDIVESVKVRILDKYKELDKKQNVYLERYYGLNYDESLERYDYVVHYSLTTLSDTQVIDIINNVTKLLSQGSYESMKYSGDLTLNGKVFKVYDGSYTSDSDIMLCRISSCTYDVRKKVLLYEVSNGYLYIEIDGNDNDITDDILNEVTNFEVEM